MRIKGAVAGLLLVVWALALAPARATDAYPSHWRPQESYLGDEDYDARLDKPVCLWETEVTLDRIFSEAAEQTGVTITTDPAHRETNRIPINVYLDRKHPPTLRSLMVQLAWVVDSTFGAAGEGRERAYRLLPTDLSSHAAQALKDILEREMEARELTWKAFDERLAEYNKALSMSHEELIRRYRGKDDFLLLTFLDPKRRAAASYLCRHVHESLRPPDWIGKDEANVVGFAEPVRFEDFVPQDVEDLHQALDLPRDWLSTGHVVIDVRTSSEGQVFLELGSKLPPDIPKPPPGNSIGLAVIDLRQTAQLSEENRAALLRLLGEEPSSEPPPGAEEGARAHGSPSGLELPAHLEDLLGQHRLRPARAPTRV